MWKDFVELIDDEDGSKLSPLCWNDDDTLQFDTNAKEDDVPMHDITNTFTMSGAGANQHTKITMVTESCFHAAQGRAKKLATNTAKLLVADIKRRFPRVEVLEAFVVLKPAYWLKKSYDEDIGIKLNILYNRCGKTIKLLNEKEVTTLVGRTKVELQVDSFKALMQNVVEEGSHRGTTQSFWKGILGNDILWDILGAFCKLASIMLVIPIGYVENEHVLSAMNYIKDKKRNRLGPKHLNLCVRVKLSSYTVHSFPYLVALAKWKAAKERHIY